MNREGTLLKEIKTDPKVKISILKPKNEKISVPKQVAY